MIGKNRRKIACVIGVAALVASLPTPAGVGKGFVDGSAFVELAGDDAGIVEISLQGAFLRAAARIDPDLAALVSGLESIHAVILELEGNSQIKRARDLVRTVERDLRQKGWERLARVRDGDADVQVFVLSDEEVIRGLVVMTASEDGELVFANVSGLIDLAALAEIGEAMNVPGLDELAP